MSDDDLPTNNWVWVPDKDELFVKGNVTSYLENGMLKVTVKNGAQESMREVSQKDVESCNPAKFNKCEDMAELTHLNEPSVIYNMYLRYNDDLLYTYSGLFLVAINPYKALPIYDQASLKRFHSYNQDERLPPHIFAIAENTHRNLVANGKDQSILVTGESGAGKTENTKKVIQYLSLISTSAEEHNEIHEKILRANPILESFGNAKTVKNNNSSRFGKFIKIYFDPKGLICGATIDYYLLEKSRVSHQLKDERNYHAFYQLLKGAPSEALAQKYHLDADFHKYGYLSHSSGTISNVDDAAEYRQLKESFQVMGFSDSDVENIFLGLAVILHLGDINFISWKAEQASFKDSTLVSLIARLLGIPEAEFSINLLRPKVKAGREFVQTLKRPSEVKSIIDAFAKYLYEKIFQYIVGKINASLMGADQSSQHFIGVLDIAGFEIFDINSFEQLCINYTNEKLQQYFNHHSFILEQSEYMREDIQWEYIDFGLDLQPTINLIEARQPMGILEILNDQCIVPGATEDSFINKLLKTWGNGESKKFKPNKVRNGFIIDHYAGFVEYNVDDWLQKNTDPISENILQLLGTSSNDFIRELFGSANGSSLTSSHTTTSSANKSSKFKTVTQRYKEQLSYLMKELGGTEPHFVRCILPNLFKKPNKFEKRLVLSQLRCNGVLEGIRIARAGFPNKMSYSDFFLRYSILNTVDVFTKNTKSNSELILKYIKLDPDCYRIGITKIFFKNGILGHLEELRDSSLKRVLSSFQSVVRGKQARRNIRCQLELAQASQVVSRNIQKLDELVIQGGSPWLKLFVSLKPLLEDSVKVLATTEMNENLKQLNGKLKDAENAKAMAETENTSLKERLCALEDEIINVNKAAGERATLLRSFESETKSQEGRLRDTSNQLAELKAASEKLTDSKKALQIQCEQSLLNIVRLEKQLKELQTELLEAKEKTAILEMKLETANSNTSLKSEKEEELEKSLQHETEKYTALEAKHNNASNRAIELQKELKDAQNQLAEKTRKIRSLETSQNLLSAEIALLQTMKKERMEDSEQQRRTAAKLRIGEEALQDAREQMKVLKARITQLELENSHSEQSKKRIVQDSENARDAVISEKRRELDALEIRLRILDEQVKSYQQQVEEVTAQLEEQMQRINGQSAKIEELTKALHENSQLQKQLTKEKEASAVHLADLKTSQESLNAHLQEHKQTVRNLENLKHECQHLQRSKDAFSDQVIKLKVEKQKLESKLQDKENVPPATPAYDPALVGEYAAMKTKFNEQSAILRSEKFENQKLIEENEMLREKVRGTFESPLKRSTARRSLEVDDSMRVSQTSEIRLSEEVKNLRIRLQQEEASVLRAENYAVDLQKKLNKFQATRSIDASDDDAEKLKMSQSRIVELEKRLSTLLCGPQENITDSSKVGMSPSSSLGAIASGSGPEFAKIYSDMNQTLKTTREELNKAKSEILRLKSLLRDSEDDLYEIKRESVKASVRDYEDQLARLKVNNNSLEQQVEDLKKSTSESKKKCDEYYEKLELVEAAAAMNKRQQELCQEELKEKSIELKLMKEELRATDKVIRELRDDKHELESNLKDLEVTETKLRALNKSLQDQMKYLNDNYGDRKRSVEDYKEEIRALQEDVKFKMAKETEIIKENKKLKLDNEELIRVKEEVLVENKEVTDENEAFVQRNEEYKNEIELLLDTKKSYERKLELNAKQLRTLYQIVEENGRQMEELNALNRELEKTKAAHENQIADLDEQLKKASANVDISREHAENMERERKSARAELDDIKHQWDNSDDRYKKARTENLVLVEESESLKTINDELRAKIGALEEKLYSNEQLKYLENNMKTLKDQLAIMKNNDLDRDAKEQKLKQSFASLKYDLETKTVQMKKYNDENFALQNTVGQQKGKIEYLHQENSDKDLKIKVQERELVELRERLAEVGVLS